MNSNTKKITVLFPYPKLHPFIKDDIDTLTLKYNVITRAFNSSKGFAVIIEFIKSFLFTLRHIAKVDVVYSFFPDYHCFFPFLFGKLLGKKVILITGGYESVYIPTIEYGAIAKNTIHGKVCRFLIE